MPSAYAPNRRSPGDQVRLTEQPPASPGERSYACLEDEKNLPAGLAWPKMTARQRSCIERRRVAQGAAAAPSCGPTASLMCRSRPAGSTARHDATAARQCSCQPSHRPRQARGSASSQRLYRRACMSCMQQLWHVLCCHTELHSAAAVWATSACCQSSAQPPALRGVSAGVAGAK